MSDGDRRDEDAPEDEEGPPADEQAGDDAPAPATWAGRQAWSGLPDDGTGDPEAPGEEVDAEDGSDEGELGEEESGTGLTEEFDVLEQEFADDLDTELAGEHELAQAAEARADEGPEPADEFEFADEEGEADAEDQAAEEDQADAEDQPAEEKQAEVEDADRSEDADASEESAAAGVAAGTDEAGATVEADTLAAADQEEAREAALQGLRNRTAEHAAKRGVTDPGRAPAPAAKADEAGAAESEGDEPKTAVAATAAPATAALGEDGEKPPRAGVWARFMAASFLIIASMATATSVSLLVYLTDIAKGLGGLNLSDQLDEIDENAQNFLIIGSDVRPDQSSKGLSDTTMLLRVDPEAGAITQLSIPRDLRVSIPGHGVDKFNAAYSYGGPKLTLEVVKQITGDRIPIHHVVNVDFNGFADAVDAIGCVYIDVDRDYFNDNSTAASVADQYAEIDIQAGYQRLCGFKALQYVRYRHEDNDIVRAARQQGFLREARQKVPPGKLIEERNKLLDIFTDYTTSDIDDSGTLVGLFKLMLDARGAQITQIEFPFDSLNEEGYITASDKPLRDAVDKFLGEAPAAPPQGDGGEGGGSGKGDQRGDGKGEQEDQKEPKEQPGGPQQTPEEVAAAQMIDSTASGQQYAAAIREQGGEDLKFPILYPTRIAPGFNAGISDDTRYFGIDGGDGRLFHGYKFVMTMPGTTYNPAYYGVSGTDWVGAPLFANPSTTRTIGKREYKLYYDGPALRMVAFERDKAMYWVTNTLDKLLTEPQMIAIAQNLSEAGS